jgi:hypothetical protein
MREDSQEDQISHVAGEFPTSNQKKKIIVVSGVLLLCLL